MIIKKSQIHGLGYFTDCSIGNGCVIDQEEYRLIGIEYEHLFAFVGLEKFTFVPPGQNDFFGIFAGPMGYVNHSEEKPNAYFHFSNAFGKKFVYLVASRKIEKGEEILVNYNLK